MLNSWYILFLYSVEQDQLAFEFFSSACKYMLKIEIFKKNLIKIVEECST